MGQGELTNVQSRGGKDTLLGRFWDAAVNLPARGPSLSCTSLTSGGACRFGTAGGLGQLFKKISDQEISGNFKSMSDKELSDRLLADDAVIELEVPVPGTTAVLKDGDLIGQRDTGRGLVPTATCDRAGPRSRTGRGRRTGP